MSVLRSRISKMIALGAGALAMTACQPVSPEPEASTEQPSNVTPGQAALEMLSPDVREFIKDTYLFHAADVPDANETVDVLRQYMEGNELLGAGDYAGAISVFEKAAAAYPDSRHAQAGLAYSLWARYEAERSPADLERATDAFVKAAELGMDHGKVRYTDMLSRALVEQKDATRFDALFQRALKLADRPVVGNRAYAITLDHANGLAGLGRPEAEQSFKKSLALSPAGNIDALVGYGQWLLDNGRPAEVLSLISPQVDADYPHFLRGVALDRLGQPEAAVAEYKRFAEFSKSFPAPARYRIAGSPGQAGVSFEDDIQAETHCAGHTRLSIMLYCEARGESEGGQRLVGWTARKRVFRGTISGCISINNSGATLCDKYYNVIGQSGQFYIGCGTRSATSDHVAHDVFNGYANDPLSGYCAGSSTTSTTCDGAFHCPGGTDGAGVHSPVWFDLGCTASTTCKHNHGTLCGNDNVGNDHCFYNNH